MPPPLTPPPPSSTTTTNFLTNKKEGPLSQTLETIRLDNRKLVKELLLSDPRPSSAHRTANNNNNNNTAFFDSTNPFNPLPPSSAVGGGGGGLTKQRIVFATTSLQNVILRHVLSTPKADEVYAKLKKLKKEQQQKSSSSNPKNKHSSKDNNNIIDDVPLPKALGIISSRVLLKELPLKEEQVQHNNNNNAQHSNTQLGIGAGGTEVSLSSLSSAFPSIQDDYEEEEGEENDASLVTCFTKNEINQVRAVCAYIKRQHRKLQLLYSKASSVPVTPIHYRIVFVPHITSLSEKLLLDEGILPLETTSVTSLPIDLIPLDEDVLTLEYESVLRDVELEGCAMDVVSTVARSIMKLQDVLGTTTHKKGSGISNIVRRLMGLGEMGEAVIGKVLNMRLEEFGYEEDDEDEDEEEEEYSEDESIGTEGDKEADAAGGGGKEGKGNDAEEKEAEEITAMLILDRRVDMVTPMLTPLTYEGLLDDVLGIDCGFIQVGTDIIDPPSRHDQEQTNDAFPSPSTPPPPPTENTILNLPLNDIDTLYSEVRDQHVETFGSFLQGQAKALKESHSAFTDKGKKKNLNEIHQFVKQIPIFTQNLRSLTTHIHLAELVKQTTEESSFRQRWQTERSMVESEQCYDMLEDLIACQEPPYQLLRLLCLQSLTSGGIKSAKFDSLRREVVQTYGYEYLFVLNNLEKANLLRRKDMTWMDTASPFSSLRKQLALINAEVNTIDPDDVSYVSSGYAPLTARLVQTATQGWTGKDEALRELPGRLIDVTQQDIPEDFAMALKRSNIGPGLASSIRMNTTMSAASATNKKKPVLVVYFVGGVSLMEIAALRFLSKRPSFPFSIVCCTTKIVNGGTLLKSLS